MARSSAMQRESGLDLLSAKIMVRGGDFGLARQRAAGALRETGIGNENAEDGEDR